MRILIICAAYPPSIKGGGEISTQYLGEAFASTNHAVTVLAASDADCDEIQNKVVVLRRKSPNSPWSFLPHRSLRSRLIWHFRENWNTQAVLMVRATIRATQPDLVLTSTIENFGGAAWIAAHLEGVKCVHILRSYFPICWRGSLFRGGRNCIKCCVTCTVTSLGRRNASKFVDGLIGVSKHVLLRHLEEKVFQKAVTTVLPEPLPPSYYTTPRATLGRLPRFGFLGVLTENKGVALLSDAWHSVPTGAATLSIAGTGNAEYVTQLHSAARDDIKLLGWVSAIEFLAQVDFLIVPSIWMEPFGRIVIEAFAQGIPVIGSATGGINELIEQGITGFLFESGSPIALGESINAALSMNDAEYQTMSKDCRLAAEHFRADIVAEAHIQFFKRVLEPNSQ